jgi:hypothetical protein
VLSSATPTLLVDTLPLRAFGRRRCADVASVVASLDASRRPPSRDAADNAADALGVRRLRASVHRIVRRLSFDAARFDSRTRRSAASRRSARSSSLRYRRAVGLASLR